MAIKKRTQITVKVRWNEKRVRDGLMYASLRWREPKPGGGTKRREEGLGYLTPDQAEVARAKHEAELRLGLERTDSERGYTVGDLLVDYLEEVEASPAGDRHKDRVAGDCDGLVRHLGGVLVDQLTTHHVKQYMARRSREKVVRVRRRKGEPEEKWLERVAEARVDPNGKPVSSTTIKNEIASLRRAMKSGRDAGRVRAHPVPLPHSKALPKDKRPARRVTEREVEKLVHAAPKVRPEHTTLVEVFGWSGRRPIAIFDLHVEDCVRLTDPALPREQRLVYWRADKAGEGRGWAPVTEPTYQAIRRRLEELGDVPRGTRLWTTATGRPLRSNTWPQTFAKIAAAAEVEDVKPYDLRKHACAQLLRALGNPEDAIKYSGHKTVEMFFRTYSYSLEGNAEERAASIGWTPQPLRFAAGAEDRNGGQNGGRPAEIRPGVREKEGR